MPHARGPRADAPPRGPEPPDGGAAAVLAIAAACAVLTAAGCGPADLLRRRIDALPDRRARNLVRDALWRHGSLWAWAEAGALEADVLWTEHRPGGDLTERQRWVVDPLSGRCRIEIPETGERIVRDGLGLRVTRNGKRVDDPTARARAATLVRLATELLPLPASLPAPGHRVRYLGRRTGPGEARAWERLLVTYDPATGAAPGDRLVVELRAPKALVDRVLVVWADPPLAGRPYRVEMDAPLPAGDLLVSRRWRLIPADAEGRPTGPPRYTVRVERVRTGAEAP